MCVCIGQLYIFHLTSILENSQQHEQYDQDRCHSKADSFLEQGQGCRNPRMPCRIAAVNSKQTTANVGNIQSHYIAQYNVNKLIKTLTIIILYIYI